MGSVCWCRSECRPFRLCPELVWPPTLVWYAGEAMSRQADPHATQPVHRHMHGPIGGPGPSPLASMGMVLAGKGAGVPVGCVVVSQ